MEEPTVSAKVTKKVKQVRSKRMMFLARAKRRILTHVWALRLAFLSGILLFLILVLLGITLLLNSFGLSRYTNLLSTFIFTPQEKISSIGGRTNILILGKGGSGHEAPDLTDTMMVVSVSHSSPNLTLISLPRDIWIPELRAKLNSAYYWGNKQSSGGGVILASAAVEEILGEPIQYVLVIDFSGLKKVVDVVGDVEVDVETAFTDTKYPITGRETDLCNGDREFKCRYETIRFEKGTQKMNGETVLKFVRSRNAEGDEGTDFARAARQQRVIDGIEKKLVTREVYLSPSKIRDLLALFDEVTETDLTEEALAILARRFLDSKGSRKSYVLGEDLLINPRPTTEYDNLYVFTPKAGSWSEVHKWVDSLLKVN